jgi:putative membrane protein
VIDAGFAWRGRNGDGTRRSEHDADSVVVVKLLARAALAWAGNLLALWVATLLIDSVNYSSFAKLAIAAVVFGLANTLIKPVLKVVGCLLIVLTLGVALFFINMAMLAFTAWVVPGFGVGGFWSVAGGTVIVWLVNLVVHVALERLLEKDDRRHYA